MSYAGAARASTGAGRPAPVDALLVVTADHVGGMQRIVATVGRDLSARGAAVRVLVPASPGGHDLQLWLSGQGLDAATHPSVTDAASARSYASVLGLRAAIRRQQPRVVNIHYGDVNVSIKDVLAARLAGAPRLVLSIHGSSTWEQVGRRKRLVARAAGLLANRLVVVSQGARERLLEAGVPAAKIAVIPNGIQPPTSAPSRTAARAALGIRDGEPFVVGTLARLVWQKNVSSLIRAFRAFAEAGDGQAGAGRVLLIGGDGPERGALEEQARHLPQGSVVFLGEVRDTSAFYAALDLFVLPSVSEAFGLVFLEAAVHGVPSVGSSVGGVPEVIVDGATGLLVPPRDDDALAAAIASLEGDRIRLAALGWAARLRATSGFTLSRMVDRYADVLLSPA